MGSVIELNPHRSGLVKGAPDDIFMLRWRFVLKNGSSFISSWTPETRYPSLAETMENLKDDIATVFVDGQHRYIPNEKITFLKMPVEAFRDISYKGGYSANAARTQVIGIEVRDLEGNTYLILRDGTVHLEKVRGGKAYVANND